jgi:hypothetical protein
MVGDPLPSSHAVMPQVSADDFDFRFAFARNDAPVASASLMFEWGTDLNNWKQVPIGAQSSAADFHGGSVIVTNGQGSDSIVVKVPRINQTNDKLFGRIAVTPTP